MPGAWPEKCPFCLSKYTSIHGMIWHNDEGVSISRTCDNAWHRGPDYRPDILILTENDREFLRSQRIAIS